MKYIFTLLLITILSCNQKELEKTSNQNKTSTKTLKVLLVGSFHFENFNPKNNGDVLQVNIPDVLTKKTKKN